MQRLEQQQQQIERTTSCTAQQRKSDFCYGPSDEQTLFKAALYSGKWRQIKWRAHTHTKKYNNIYKHYSAYNRFMESKTTKAGSMHSFK